MLLNLVKGLGVEGLLRSEEHTSELQSQSNLVCRLLLEKKKNSGIMSIIDSTGKTIASSSVNVNSKDADANPSILNIINTSQNGFGTYVKNGETNYVVFEKLPTFGWSIVYEKPYSSLLSGNTSLNQLELQISIVAVSVGIAGFSIVFLISFKKYRPFMQFAKPRKAQEGSNFRKKKNLKNQKEMVKVV